jgi:hypothetical protein
MRKFAVLGASALILALGVAQASASAQSNGQSWADYVARTSAQPAQPSAVDFRNFRAQVADQNSLVPSTGQSWADYVARTSRGSAR